MGRPEDAEGVTNSGYTPDHEEKKPPPYDDCNLNYFFLPEQLLMYHSLSEAVPPSTTNIMADGMRDVATMTQKEINAEKFAIWKNVVVISVAFIFLFTAFNSMGNVQVCRLFNLSEVLIWNQVLEFNQ